MTHRRSGHYLSQTRAHPVQKHREFRPESSARLYAAR